jgi:hypothetical protein
MGRGVKGQDRVSDYNEEFIKSISLKDVNTSKDLKELLTKLEKANEVMTSFYKTVFSDYVMSINNNADSAGVVPDLATVKKYKSLTSKIQRAYNYILYLSTFENPFSNNK